MLALLLCSEAYAKALVKFLKSAHVPQETFTEKFENCVVILTADNRLGFSDVDLTPEGRKPSKALHVSIECRGTTLAHRLDCEGLTLKPSNIVVRDFDDSKRMVHGEVDIPIKVGSQIFDSTFYVMDILSAYSCLLGLPWIHGAGAVTSSLHQKLQYPMKGKFVTVYGE